MGDTGFEAAGVQIENECKGYQNLLKKFGKIDADTIEGWDDGMRMTFLNNHVKMRNGWSYDMGQGHEMLAKVHIEQLVRMAALIQATNGTGEFRRGDKVIDEPFVATQRIDTRNGPVDLDDEGRSEEQFQEYLAQRRWRECPTFTISRCWQEFISYEVPDEVPLADDSDDDGGGAKSGGGGGAAAGLLANLAGAAGGIRFAFGKMKHRWYFVSYNVALTIDELHGRPSRPVTREAGGGGGDGEGRRRSSGAPSSAFDPGEEETKGKNAADEPGPMD